jgi:Spy/CpxP family protein refolding chaperone
VSERRNLAIAILVAFVFGVAGGMVGTLATVALVHHGRGPIFSGEPHPGGPFGHGPGWRGERGRPGRPGRPGMERILHRQLDLTDEQRERIEQILDDARPRYAAVRESTRMEIDRVLTPGQRTRLKQLEDRFPARRRERAAP